MRAWIKANAEPTTPRHRRPSTCLAPRRCRRHGDTHSATRRHRGDPGGKPHGGVRGVFWCGWHQAGGRATRWVVAPLLTTARGQLAFVLVDQLQVHRHLSQAFRKHDFLAPSAQPCFGVEVHALGPACDVLARLCRRRPGFGRQCSGGSFRLWIAAGFWAPSTACNCTGRPNHLLFRCGRGLPAWQSAGRPLWSHQGSVGGGRSGRRGGSGSTFGGNRPSADLVLCADHGKGKLAGEDDVYGVLQGVFNDRHPPDAGNTTKEA